MIISIKKDVATEINWSALDSIWADRYEEEYGHCFSDRSYTDNATRFPILTAMKASVDSYI